MGRTFCEQFEDFNLATELSGCRAAVVVVRINGEALEGVFILRTEWYRLEAVLPPPAKVFTTPAKGLALHKGRLCWAGPSLEREGWLRVLHDHAPTADWVGDFTDWLLSAEAAIKNRMLAVTLTRLK